MWLDYYYCLLVFRFLLTYPSEIEALGMITSAGLFKQLCNQSITTSSRIKTSLIPQYLVFDFDEFLLDLPYQHQ